MTRLDGPDISHHQYDAGPVDLAATRSAGCWWISMKVTQGTSYVDPTFEQSRAAAHAAGFTHIGLYHWLSSTSDPVAQAHWFLVHIGALRDGEFASLDAEEAGITAGECIAWCEAVDPVTGRPAEAYTGYDVAAGTIWQSTRLRSSVHGPRPMHLAAYTTEARAKALRGVATYPWDAWQFSSNGPVPGITGRCDMNRIDNRAAYDLAAGIGNTPPVETEPAPTPVPTTPTEDEPDMPKYYVADSATKGSALVTTTVAADGTPHYSMVGFTDGQIAEAWRGAYGAKSYSDPDYDALAAGATH